MTSLKPQKASLQPPLVKGGNRRPYVEENGERIYKPHDVRDWDPEAWPPVVDYDFPPRLTWDPPIRLGPLIIVIPAFVRGRRQNVELYAGGYTHPATFCIILKENLQSKVVVRVKLAPKKKKLWLTDWHRCHA